MKKSLAVTLVALFVLAVSFAMVPKKANAIPAFAQKYHFSCAVCHTVFPNLNPFGRAFWRNGFRLPGTNGTPADATQISNGLALPNPWPIPVMIEPIISYTHNGNENVSPQTDADAFTAEADLVSAGAFKVYTPFANSISFYVHYNSSTSTAQNPHPAFSQKQIFASLNGIGSGFGIAPHLLNLKIGQVTTASPYFYRQMPFYNMAGPVGNGQGLNIGYDGEAGNLIHARNEGLALYGTPGYHLWYKVTMTNDSGTPSLNNSLTKYSVSNGEATGSGTSNAMEYSYQLKEYYPVPVGQLEFGYYGATVAEPLQVHGASWTDRIMVNGVDVDLANDIYELGLTWMEQNDSNPYAPSNYSGGPNAFNGTTGIDNTSNGYSDFEVYGRYLFPQVGKGLMLMADYATYSWSHKNAQEAFNGTLNTSCSNSNLYGTGYVSGNCTNDGIKDAFALQAEYNLAYNAHLYLGYTITNHTQFNTLDSGLDFAF